MAMGWLVVVAIFVATMGSALAQEGVPPAGITVFAPGMVGAGLGVLAAAWKKKTGNNVTVVGGSLGAVETAMSAQPGDLAILPANAFSKQASVEFSTAPASIGHIAFALAVKAGAAHPDISTQAKFRAALAGKTVAYNDPAGGSIAGAMVEKILSGPDYAGVQRLAVRGNATMAIGAGTASMVVGVMPEILQVPEAEVAGLVPAALDLHIDLSGAVIAGSAHSDMAKAFLAYLTGSEVKAVWAANGIVAQ
jgi:molybdate transport system substrate-binding protein